MHDEILTGEQKALVPLVRFFSKNFGLVGGTAIALHLGHRRSIDFDLFSKKEFNNGAIRRTIRRMRRVPRVVRDEKGQYTLLVNGVYFTFFQYPHTISYPRRWGDVIKLPDLVTLAAMKAHALGRRAKWKDYVDLYFISRLHHTMKHITARAKKIFKQEFNESFFRQQLAYFQDIDYSETVIYMPGFETDDETIKKALLEFSIS